MTLDLTGDIAAALDGAALDGKAPVVAYVRADGSPALSYRGSLLVLGPQLLGFWARRADSGIATELAERPQVAVLYYAAGERPGPPYLSIRGRARVDRSADDAVWDAMIEKERRFDADRRGVAIVIDVDRVDGKGPGGAFTLER